MLLFDSELWFSVALVNTLMPTETCIIMSCIVTISIGVVVDWDSYLFFMEMNDKLIDGDSHTEKNSASHRLIT
jgi:hypothetical protein